MKRADADEEYVCKDFGRTNIDKAKSAGDGGYYGDGNIRNGGVGLELEQCWVSKESSEGRL